MSGGLTLAALLAIHGTAVAGSWPDSTVSLGARLSPLTRGIALHAAGQSPTVSVGALSFGLASEAAISPGSGSTGFRLQSGARAQLGFPSGMAWLGIAGERRTRSDHAPKSPIFDAGAMARRGPVGLLARARHRTLEMPQPPRFVTSWTAPPGFQSPPGIIPTVPYWEPRDPVRASVTSIEVAASWTRSRWSFEAASGMGVGNRVSPIWLGRVQAMRWLRPGLGVTLGAATTGPTWFSDDFTDRPRVHLGVLLEPRQTSPGTPVGESPRDASAISGWDIVKLGPGLYAFRVRARAVERVALRGDITGWEPVALRSTSGGWWEAILPVSPGLHRVEVSVNGGGWQPPNGISTTEGEYGGMVGTFLAE
jgi:hypothetical protein